MTSDEATCGPTGAFAFICHSYLLAIVAAGECDDAEAMCDGDLCSDSSGMPATAWPAFQADSTLPANLPVR